MKIKCLFFISYFFFHISGFCNHELDSLQTVLAETTKKSEEWLNTSKRLIDAYIQEKRIEEAKKQIQESIDVADAIDSDLFQLQSYLQLGKIIGLKERDFEAGIEKLDTALSFYQPAMPFFLYADANYKKVNCLFLLDRFAECIPICKGIIAQKDKFAPEEEYLCEFYHSTLAVVYKKTSQLDSALHYNKIALEIAERINADAYYQIYSNIANIYIIQGLYDKALENNNKVIELSEKAGDYYTLGMVLGNRGDIYSDLGNFEKSIEFHRKALTTRKTNKVDLHKLVHSYVGLASGFLDNGQLDSCLFYLKLSEKSAEKFKDKQSLLQAQLIYGNYYKAKGKVNLAIEKFENCLLTAQKNEQDHKYIYAAKGISDIYFEQEELDTALVYLEKALPKLEDLKSRKLELEIYERFANIYEKKGKEEQELYWLKKVVENQKSIKETVNQAKVTELITRFETLQKQKAIKLLEDENSQKSKLLQRNYLLGGFTFLIFLLAIIWLILRRNKAKRQMIEQLKNVEDQIKEGDAKERDFAIFDSQSEKYIENISEGIKELKTSVHLQKSKEEELKTLIDGLKTFNYTVSHDLRKPVQRIKNIAYLLEEVRQENLSDTAKEYLHNITGSIEQMEKLIEAMFNFSQLDGQKFFFTAFSLEELVNEIIENQATDIQEKGIEVLVTASSIIYSDREFVKRILSNLIDNAIKFSVAEKKSFIEIKGEARGDSHIITVSDNGIGFDIDEAHKIFDLFYQAKNSKPQVGTGIGLSIVKRIVEKLEGTITAQGKLNEGTIFTISLPK